MKAAWWMMIKAAGIITGLILLTLNEPTLPRAEVSWSVTIRAQLGIGLFVVAGGTYLYKLRQLLPGVYGFAEVLIGLAVALYVLNLAAGMVSNKGNAAIAIVGALYIIVRGYDNLYRSLKTPRMIQGWNRVFFDRDTDVKL